MGLAQLDIPAHEDSASTVSLENWENNGRDLKSEVAERLRVHRERRTRGRALVPEETSIRGGSPASAIAAAVAERYAQRPSYRTILAEQARAATERATLEAEKAAAEAQIAARNAEVIAQAEHELMAELELWNVPQEFTVTTAEVVSSDSHVALPAGRTKGTKVRNGIVCSPEEIAPGGLTVRLYEDLGRRETQSSSRPNESSAKDHEEALALDEEIAFRQAPVFEPFFIEPTVPLAANLLEFPRQLVAARKARPRAAEGPLADEPARNPQLRIFEVEPDQISTTAEVKPTGPEWLSIRLDASPQTEVETGVQGVATPLMPAMPPPQTAPLQLRVMAEIVDWCVVGIGFVGFVAVVAHTTQRLPTGVPAAAGAAVTLGLFYLAYELLFFTLSDQTPGMRYARIGLCTLSDENPTRRAIRRRILAQLVAICPFGLGLLWALLDDESLGWHDRISRMYQRSY